MTEGVNYRSATDLSRGIKQGVISPIEVVEASLDRIDELDGDINAFRVVFRKQARKRAREAKQAVERGEILGPLHGVPVAIKDSADVAGYSTPGGKKPLLDNPVEKDSVVVERLRDAGAILIGKTRVPELGYGTTDQTWSKPTATPFDLSRNSGGSSGGSAAAVAAGMVSLGLGTDGGGSIRIPSSFSGVFGFKPSFRRIPRLNSYPTDAFSAIVPFSDFGPITRTVEDAALMLQVMTGTNRRDPFTHPMDTTNYLEAINESIKELRIAYSPNLDTFPVAPAVSEIIDSAVDEFRTTVSVEKTDVGFDHDHQTITETWMSWVDVSRALQVKTLAENGIDLFENHQDEIQPEYFEAVKRGRNMSAVEFRETSHIRTDVLNSICNTLEEYDLLLAPTVAVLPVANDDDYTTGPAKVNGEAVNQHIGWCLTHPINFSGHPAANVPAGFTESGLPVGMQIVGRRFQDDLVLAASAAFEHLNPWIDVYPPDPITSDYE